MRARLVALLALGLFSRCQCLVPVEEEPDAGEVSRDAGEDAGRVDAGLDGGPRCVTPSQCPQAPSGLCLTGTPVSTCLDGHCVWDCNAVSRTCVVDAGAGGSPCLRCLNEETHCGSCGRARVCTFTVRNGTCGGRFANGERFVVHASSTACGGAMQPTDGGPVAGYWTDVWDATSLVRLEELGGECLISRLATGAPRAVVSCPACAFVTEGCE